MVMTMMRRYADYDGHDTDGGDDDSFKDDDTSIHIEAIYRFQVNDNISLTPGLFVITNPNHDDVNDTIWISTFRTQFVF